MKQGVRAADLPFERLERILVYVQHLSLDNRTFMAKARLSEEVLRRFRRSGRVPCEVIGNSVRAVVDMLPEELRQSAWVGGFGVALLRQTAYCAVTAGDLGGALEKIAELHSLLDGRYPRTLIQRDKKQARVIYVPPDTRYISDLLPRRTDADYIESVVVMMGLSTWIRFLRWLAAPALRIQAIGIRGTAFPRHLIRRLDKISGRTPVLLGQTQAYLEFSADYLQNPILQTPKTAQLALSVHIERLLAEGAEVPVTEILLAILGDDLSEGCPSFDEVAQRLFVSRSNLGRRLRDENTSYHQLKVLARQQMAFRLLRETDMPLRLVAGRCGFISPASFSRVFRQWTGTSPSEYRDHSGNRSSLGNPRRPVAEILRQ